MINILISSIFSSIILISYGALFNKLFFSKKLENVDPRVAGIYGFIIVGFISLYLNFFFPINKIIGTVFFIFSLIFFIFYFIKLEKKNEFILLVFFVSITSFLVVTLSNINRPDAGLYHLPYISILQENKVILGLTNLHYRFGHTSIFQYISAIYNNYFLKNEFINFPLASLISFYILYLFKNFNESLRRKKKIETVSIFLIIIFSLYSFNRYSNYGNDAPASIYFFILILLTLKIENIKKIDIENFFNILIISIFLLTIKPFMVIVFALPLFLFLLNNNKIRILKHKNSLICVLLIISWVVKNFLISGCAIFPIKETCINKINYYDAAITNIASTEAEAWSKAHPDSINKLSFNEYISNYNWVNTWFKSHFKKIMEKLTPFLLFLILFFLIKITRKPYFDNFNYKFFFKNKNILLIIFFSLYCCFFWFLKFPVYRFGMAFISSFIIFLFINLFVTEKFFYNKKTYYSIIGIGLILFYGKNLNRIFNNLDLTYNNYPWPKIYSMSNEDENIKKKFIRVTDDKNNFIYYYSNGEECMYSNTPCSNYYKDDLLKKSVLGYSIYFFKID
tara:strand:- start:1951 stop:3648 length:1698 start_codon:yes stop_codon:yes gene_type:complete